MTAAVLMASMGPLLYNMLRKRAENAILSVQNMYQNVLLQASSGMLKEHDLDRLISLIYHLFKRYSKIDNSLVFIYDKERNLYESIPNASVSLPLKNAHFTSEHEFISYLRSIDTPVYFDKLPEDVKGCIDPPFSAGLVVPLHFRSALIGFLLLGEKQTGGIYTQEDVEMFERLSITIALSITNCQIFADYKKAREKLFSKEAAPLIDDMTKGIEHKLGNSLNHFSVTASEQYVEIEDILRNHSAILEKTPELKDKLNRLLKSSEYISDNVQKTLNVVSTVIAYAKIKFSEPVFTHFRAQGIMEDYAHLLKLRDRNNTCTLQIDLGENDTLYGDKTQITECLYGLLDNAYEALQEKIERFPALTFKPTMKIKLKQKDGASYIEISDNGIGIRKEEKPKIFTPSYTTKIADKRTPAIGLSIIKLILEDKHKGKLEFVSTFGDNTTFFITLPSTGVQ